MTPHQTNFAMRGRDPQTEPTCAACAHIMRTGVYLWCDRNENRNINGWRAVVTDTGGCDLYQSREREEVRA